MYNKWLYVMQTCQTQLSVQDFLVAFLGFSIYTIKLFMNAHSFLFCPFQSGAFYFFSFFSFFFLLLLLLLPDCTGWNL